MSGNQAGNLMMTDPIADMLTRIRNGYLGRKHEVQLPYSKMKHAIADILAAEGYLSGVERIENGRSGFPELKAKLLYPAGRPALTNVDRISKPGHRTYRKKTEIPRVQSGFGVAIVSTSRGIMTNKKAKELGIGGEVICTVY